VVDGLDDGANLAYGAWPDRLFAIGADGDVAFRGEAGPRGFDPGALEAALKRIIAAGPSLPIEIAPVEPAPAPEAATTP